MPRDEHVCASPSYLIRTNRLLSFNDVLLNRIGNVQGWQACCGTQNLFSKAIGRSAIKWSRRESLMDDDVRGWAHRSRIDIISVRICICVCVYSKERAIINEWNGIYGTGWWCHRAKATSPKLRPADRERKREKNTLISRIILSRPTD